MRRRAFLALSILLIAAPPALQAQDRDVVVYLVRHAERAEDGTNDPPISEDGWARAELLATLLADAGITQIHSTDYKRTIQTGTPTAEALSLEIESYDPRDLPTFAAELSETPGRHLVLGHSNTTPGLAEALGGDSHGPIDEFEYDRLYIVTISDNRVSTVLLRFGELHTP
jgi:phosphohistidine phosphatase SixA